MTKKDLKIIDDRMERVCDIVREMVGETDEIKLKDLRGELVALAGGTRGIVAFYLIKED